MEWVETTARTVDEAKDFLLDKLGVDEPETEFEVLEEPKPGLFGRTKGQARVRARVAPKTPPSRDGRRKPAKTKERSEGASKPKSRSADKAPADGAKTEAAKSEARPSSNRAPRDENAPRLDSEVAKTESTTFLTELLTAFDVKADVSIAIDDDGDLSAEISGANLGRLIGPRGGVISAIEELNRTRLQHVASGGSTPRFKLDIGGYRATRRPNLEILVDEVIEKVRTTGEPHVLDVVMSGERKLVHDRVGETASDLQTHSEGQDPVRRVVLSPAEG